MEKRLGIISCVAIVLAVLSFAAAPLIGCKIYFNRAFGGYTVNIDDGNREEIAPLISEVMAECDDYRGIEDALSVSKKGGFIKGATTITVLYRNGNPCAVKHGPAAYFALDRYISENGYKTYTHSSKYVFDIILLCFTILLFIVCVVFLIVTKRRQKAQDNEKPDIIVDAPESESDKIGDSFDN